MQFLVQPRRGKLTQLAWIGILLLWACVSSLQAQTAISKEYQIKAVFLYNFAQFVEWPSSAFSSSDAPFCIGILGDDPFGDFLDETVQGEEVKGHPLIIRRFSNIKQVKKCQILFVSHSQIDQLKPIFAALKDRPVLTVGDTEGFVRSGGILRFVTEKNQIHLRISPETAKRAGLTISSKILRLAEIVEVGTE